MSRYVKSALIGGLQGGFLALMLEIADQLVSDYIDILVCFAFIGCGLLAARFHVRTCGLSLSGGEAVGIGALAGALAGALGGFITAAGVSAMMVAGIGPGQSEVMEALTASGALDGPGAHVVELVIAYIHVVLAVSLACTGAALGLAGGAMGWRIWRLPKGDEPGTAVS